MAGTQSLITRPKKALMENPERGAMDPAVMRLLLQLVPTLTGAAIGVIEGLAKVGKFETWANLDAGWKSTIFGSVAGIALYLERYWAKSDPEKSRAMFSLNAVAWSQAVMHGTVAIVERTVDTGDPVIEPEGDDKGEGKPQKGLMVQRGLAALASDDAADARQAIEEIVAHREQFRDDDAPAIDLGAIPVQAIEAMAIDFRPVNLRRAG